MKEDGEWEIVPHEAEVVRRIYQNLLDGKRIDQIARELSEEKVLTPRGNNYWGRTTILSILRSVVYKGCILYQKTYIVDTLKKKRVNNNGELPKFLIEDHHPAIVSLEIWGAVQVEMKRRNEALGKKKEPQPHTRQEFFKTFYCSECGSLVTHWAKDGDHYWRCKVAYRNNYLKECTAKSLRETVIEHTFMKMLQEMKLGDQFITKVKQAIEKVMPSEDDQKRMEKVKEEMQSLYQELYQAVDIESNSGGQDPQLISQLTDNIILLQKQVHETDDKKFKAEEMQEELDWLINELESIQKFNPEKERIEFRGDIFSRIVEKGTIFPDGRIVYDLRLGIQWTATGTEQKAWRLKKKGKQRKKKSK